LANSISAPFFASLGGMVGCTISRFGLLPRSRSQGETWAGGRLLGRFRLWVIQDSRYPGKPII
jgi:hypothetical protein